MLEIVGVTILLQILNFLALLYLLSRFLYKPLQARIAERAAEVEGMLDNAAKREAESYALQRQIEHRLDEVEKEAESLISQAEAEARRQSEELLRAAQQKSEALIARARLEAERERVEAMQENYEKTLDTIIDLASGVLRSVTIRQTHDDLVNNLAAYIWQRSPEEVNEYRRALAGRDSTVFISTPVPLAENQRKTITDTLSSLANRHVQLEVQQMPSLIAGLRVRIGDRIVDNSLRKQLDLVREEVGKELRQRMGMVE